MTRSIKDLIKDSAKAERAFYRREFVAPCIKGGKLTVRVEGIVKIFRPSPYSFEGWGVFRPISRCRANLVEEAGQRLRDRYLAEFTHLRSRLVDQLEGRTWLAFPANESDMLQKTGRVEPFKIHLVEEVSRLDPVIARFCSGVWLFDSQDFQADPRVTDRLREALERGVEHTALRVSGLTPEMRAAYQVAAAKSEEFKARANEARLRDALSLAGGKLNSWVDRGDNWQVSWETSTGERHTSVIAKTDLTVVSAGICLSNQDRLFDLQSIVRVVEERNSRW